MLFNSPAYIFVFLPLVASGYFVINRLGWPVGGTWWLVGASLFFYGYWSIDFLPLLLLSITVNYLLGLALAGAGQGPTQRKATFMAGLAFNLGLLGWFKYSDFFIANFNGLSGAQVPLLHLTLPLAISFFTFQQIAYLADSYRRETREQGFLAYCLFVTFFPQLIAGPIVHHREMMPQFARLRGARPDWNSIATGVFLFCVGLFKKVVIADGFAQWANAGFAADTPLGLYQAWGTSLCYSFQLYFDFSGYTDMAIGAALLFGIQLPINFNSPYRAAGIRDFWQRWHMTLTRWLRDYVYIPLGGNRRGAARSYVNLALTFVLGGLWHGAAWTFVAWGALHALGLSVQRLWRASGLRLPRAIAWLLTLLFVNAAWVLFRADDFDAALAIYRGMVGLNGVPTLPPVAQWAGWTGEWPYLLVEPSLAAGPLPPLAWLYLLLFGAVALFGPNSTQMVGLIRYEGRWRFRPGPVWAVAVALLLFLSTLQFFGAVEPSEFLYFNF